MVQWDTSEHDWLEGRGQKMYLIHMIDDATSELTERFVGHHSTSENMRLLRSYLDARWRTIPTRPACFKPHPRSRATKGSAARRTPAAAAHPDRTNRRVRFDTLTGPDLKAVNTFAEPSKVWPAAIELPRPGGLMVLQLPARSYSRLLLQAAPV